MVNEGSPHLLFSFIKGDGAAGRRAHSVQCCLKFYLVPGLVPLGSTFARNRVLVQIAHKLPLFGKVFWLGSTLVPLGSIGLSMYCVCRLQINCYYFQMFSGLVPHWFHFLAPACIGVSVHRFSKSCVRIYFFCKPDYHSHQSESDWCELVVRFGRPKTTPSKHLYS